MTSAIKLIGFSDEADETWNAIGFSWGSWWNYSWSCPFHSFEEFHRCNVDFWCFSLRNFVFKNLSLNSPILLNHRYYYSIQRKKNWNYMCGTSPSESSFIDILYENSSSERRDNSSSSTLICYQRVHYVIKIIIKSEPPWRLVLTEILSWKRKWVQHTY